MGTNAIFDRLITLHPALRAAASVVTFIRGDIFGKPGAPVESIILPYSGVISQVAALPDGDYVEGAMIGRYGATGIGVAFGSALHETTSIAAMAGAGWGLSISAVTDALQAQPALADTLFRSFQYLQAQARQTAACNAKHDIEHRLASWILRMGEESGEKELGLTQDVMAQMLGVQRASVSAAASGLQGSGVIRYRRGNLRISDYRGLEQKSCGCHRALREMRLRLLVEAAETSPS